MTAQDFLDAPPSAEEFLDAPIGPLDAPSMSDPNFRLDQGGQTDPDWEQAMAESAGIDRLRDSAPVTAILGKSERQLAKEQALRLLTGADAAPLPNRLANEGLAGPALNLFAGTIPRFAPAQSTLGKVGAGTANAAAGILEGWVSPLTWAGGALAAGAQLMPAIKTAERVAAGAFAADMAGHVPGHIADTVAAAKAGDLQGAVESGVGAAGSALFAAGAARHASELIPLRDVPNSVREAHEGPLPATPPEVPAESDVVTAIAEPAVRKRTETPGLGQPAVATENQPAMPVLKRTETPGLGEPPAALREEPATGKESLLVDPAAATDTLSGDRPGGGAETITGSNEGIASEMPAEREERPTPPPSVTPKSRRPTKERAYGNASLIDVIKWGKPIDMRPFRAADPNWNPPAGLRRHFSMKGGLKWDQVAEEAKANQIIKGDFLTAQDFAAVIDAEYALHKNFQSQIRAQQKSLSDLGKQQESFQTRVVEGRLPKNQAGTTEQVPIDNLNVGDTFQADGHKFRVTDVATDDDGNVQRVSLKDGPKFGDQDVRPEQGQLHVEKGTLKQTSPAADFLNAADVADPFALDPVESVEQQKARLAAEESAREKQARTEAMQAAADKPLSGNSGIGGDTTHFSIGEYASGHPVTLGRLDALRAAAAPEMVRLAQELGVEVRSKRMPAERRGVFIGKGPGQIAVNRSLFELGSEHQLAATLAHEIGHAIDWAPNKDMARGNILGRIATLHRFLSTTLPRNPFQSLETIITAKDRAKIRREAEQQVGAKPPKDEEADRAAWSAEVSRVYADKIVEEIEARGLVRREDIHKELWNLSQEWRPLEGEVPDSHLAYRMSSPEIYADAISVLLNNPGLLEARAPQFYKLFFDYLDRKPDVKEAYLGLQERLSRGEAATTAHQRQAGVEGFVKAEEALKDALRQDEDAMAHPHGFMARLKQENVDRGDWLGREIDRLRANGVKISPDLDPRVAWEEANWTDNEHAITSNLVFKKVVTPLRESGVTVNQLGELLKYERISGGLGARAILQMRLDELGKREFAKLKEAAVDMALRMSRGEDPNDLKAAMDRKGLPSDLVDEIRQNRLDAGTRSEIANPAAESPESVQALIRGLQESMTPEQWKALRKAAADFRTLVYEKMRQGVENGIINRHTFETTISANKDWYATFRGLDHVDEHVTPFIRRAIGTVGDIENPFYTSVLKMLSVNNVMLRNRAKLLAREVFSVHTPESWRAAETYHTGAELKVRPPAKGLARLELWEDGKKKHYDVDPYIAKAFESITPANVGIFTKTLGMFWKGIYPFIIKYNPNFLLLTNPLRDFSRTVRNYRAITGKGGNVRMIREYIRAWSTVREFVNGNMDNPTIKAMMAAKAIGTPLEGFAQHVGEDALFGAILEKYGHMTPQEQSRFSRTAMAPAHALQKVGATFEALPKVAVFNMLKQDMVISDREAATTIRRYIGTPDYKIKGTHGAVHNVAVPFLNIYLQGLRGDLDLATRPTTRGGWWMRYLLRNGNRAMIIGLATAGIFGDKIKDLFGGISEYDRSNYDVIPLGKQDGGEHGKKIIFARLPRDESARVLSAIVYKLSRLAGDAVMGNQLRPGRVASDAFATVEQVVPGLHPALDLARAWSDYLRNAPPIDGFRNRPIVPDREWAAGGWAALKPMLKWSLSKTGALNIVNYNPDADTTTEAVVSGMPVVKSLLKISDYGYAETQRQAELDKVAGRAQVRVGYEPEVVSLQQEHDRLQKLDKQRTPEQTRRFIQLRAWDDIYRRYDEMAIRAKEAGNADGMRAARDAINRMGKTVYETIHEGRRGEFRYKGVLSDD